MQNFSRQFEPAQIMRLAPSSTRSPGVVTAAGRGFVIAALAMQASLLAGCSAKEETGSARATIAGCSVFPADNAWNQDITNLPVRSNSDSYIDAMGRSAELRPDFALAEAGVDLGIPYVIVDEHQPRLPIEFRSERQSDPGPYPIPEDAPVEDGPDSDGDRHVLAVDASACLLYELYGAYPTGGGWRAGSGAVWNLGSNGSREIGFTSADAAGLPILPGLVRYDEVVEKQEIAHALRFTVANTQAGFVRPATHYASMSENTSYPAMGMRFRMKASYDCSSYSAEVRVICAALKRYGMFVADNGPTWHLSGAPDERWNYGRVADLAKISGDAFEVVDTGKIETY